MGTAFDASFTVNRICAVGPVGALAGETARRRAVCADPEIAVSAVRLQTEMRETRVMKSPLIGRAAANARRSGMVAERYTNGARETSPDRRGYTPAASQIMHLFDHYTIRGVTFRNRIFISPMCQYSSEDGMPTDWHLVHLGSRALGGAGLVMVEATAVAPEARISPWDSGIWSEAHAHAFRRITRFIKEAGAVPAIQLAHAGRKASTDAPWRGGRPLQTDRGGWQPIAPSPIPFDDGYPVPQEMTKADLDAVVRQFADAARRSLDAGLQAIEVHAAHGYLLHEFLSPLSNRRTDEYGGTLANRMRFPLRVAGAAREGWAANWPVFVRLSCPDWSEGGWALPQSVELSRELKAI